MKTYHKPGLSDFQNKSLFVAWTAFTGRQIIDSNEQILPKHAGAEIINEALSKRTTEFTAKLFYQWKFIVQILSAAVTGL